MTFAKRSNNSNDSMAAVCLFFWQLAINHCDRLNSQHCMQKITHINMWQSKLLHIDRIRQYNIAETC